VDMARANASFILGIGVLPCWGDLMLEPAARPSRKGRGGGGDHSRPDGRTEACAGGRSAFRLACPSLPTHRETKAIHAPRAGRSELVGSQPWSRRRGTISTGPQTEWSEPAGQPPSTRVTNFAASRAFMAASQWNLHETRRKTPRLHKLLCKTAAALLRRSLCRCTAASDLIPSQAALAFYCDRHGGGPGRTGEKDR
jgi:hypothetical protein